MKRIYSVDRFEELYAVCENESGEFERILKSELPLNVKEGDVIVFDGIKFFVNSDETNKRRKQIEKLESQLF